VVFHTDAVQTVGHVPVDVDAIGADLLSFAAHKFGGPKGAGVLIVKPEVSMDAAVTGGSQERNRRAGTENVLGIGGMAAAMSAAFEAMASERAMAAGYRAMVEEAGFTIAGFGAERVEHVVQILTPGKRGEDVVIGMDMRGIAVSQGSACGSGRVKESHVLKAMGYGREAGEAVRLSWGWGTVAAEVDAAVAGLKAVIG
jgi:cysteine desulfurase